MENKLVKSTLLLFKVPILGIVLILLGACAGQDSFHTVEMKRNYELTPEAKKLNSDDGAREILQIERQNTQGQDRLGLIRGTIKIANLWVHKNESNLDFTFSLNVEGQDVGQVKLHGVLKDSVAGANEVISVAYLKSDVKLTVGEVGAQVTCLPEVIDDKGAKKELSPSSECKKFFIDIYLKQKNRILTDQFSSNLKPESNIKADNSKPNSSDSHANDKNSNLSNSGSGKGNTNVNANGGAAKGKQNSDPSNKNKNLPKSNTNSSNNGATTDMGIAPAAADDDAEINDEAPIISSGGNKTNHEANIKELFGDDYSVVKPDSRFFSLPALPKPAVPATGSTGSKSAPSGKNVVLPGKDALSILSEKTNQAIGHTYAGHLQSAINMEVLMASSRVRFNDSLSNLYGKVIFGTYDVGLLIGKLANWVVESGLRRSIFIGEIAKENGGLILNSKGIKRHKSHQNGLDVDVYLLNANSAMDGVHMVESNNKGQRVASKNFLVKENFMLLMKVMSDNEVPFIMLDPVLKKTLCRYAISQKYITEKNDNGPVANVFKRIMPDPKGQHDNHFHFRLACSTDRHPNCKEEEYSPYDACML